MDPLDREVLVLRHFEELSNAEAAQVLGIKPSAAGNRYVRALKRLKDVFQGMPGGIEGISGMSDNDRFRRGPVRADRRRVRGGLPARASAPRSRSSPAATPSTPTRSARCSPPWC